MAEKLTWVRILHCSPYDGHVTKDVNNSLEDIRAKGGTPETPKFLSLGACVFIAIIEYTSEKPID